MRIKTVYILILLMCFVQNVFALETKVFSPLQSNVKATVIVLHGLNLKPEKMDEIILFLQKEGYQVVRGALSGHYGKIEESFKVNRDVWMNDCDDLYKQAIKISQQSKTQLYFVGYSLGALVFNDYLNIKKTHEIKKMVLLAPAFRTYWYTKITSNLSWLLGKDYILDSENLESYRAYKGTSLALYDALFHSQDELYKNKFKVSNIPTQIYLHSQDELVSAKGLSEIKKDFNLSQWKIFDVRFGTNRNTKAFNHLFIDEGTMGTSYWNEFKEKVHQFFGKAI